jgi:AHBA synthesis associated protein
MLESLRLLRGSTLAVVTAKIAYQAEAVVRATDLAPHFSHVQGWAQGLAPKPAPDLLHAALAALGARPDEAVYVGDTVTDVRAGHAAGSATIAVTWGFGAERELEAERPTRVARSVADLAALLRA